MKKLLLATTLLWPLTAQAADMAVKVPVLPVVSNPCTTAYCTGFYFGGFMAGNGTNADILGSGLDGSVFAGGGIPGVDIGYQYWNGKLFIDGEAGIGSQINVGTTVNGVASNETGLFGYEEVQVGGTLSALLGSTAASITPPSVLEADLISLYVAMGAVERSFANGWETGAGAKFALSPNLILDVGYRYINYGSATQGNLNFNSENLVKAGLNHKFAF